MSNKKSVRSVESVESGESKLSFGRIFPIRIIALLAIGVFGAVGSNLNLFGGSSNANPASQNSGTLNSAVQNSSSAQSASQTNPPPTSATPQLSKEYIYAGSRMLAVEDAEANAAPPADLAVWRPPTLPNQNGTFYVLGGQGSAQTFYQWGITGDKPAAGDYDGDGKTDFSIFRPSNGQWWITKSSDNSTLAFQFGASCTTSDTTNCDKVAQADFDGDGKTDAAVFRPTNSTWYILPSGGSSFYGVPFGESTDIPAPADYDGDGKADIGVWRGSNNTFYSNNSSNGATQYINIGQSGSEPVSGDYDGDGRADYAIRSGANWIIRNSSTGLIQDPIAWQMSSDLAVQNDYDGDGKLDIAVWRPTNSSANASDVGNWYIKQSGSNTTRITQWGALNDIPVPACYRRLGKG
jgi:FG-GAP-like repeat